MALHRPARANGLRCALQQRDVRNRAQERAAPRKRIGADRGLRLAVDRVHGQRAMIGAVAGIRRAERAGPGSIRGLDPIPIVRVRYGRNIVVFQNGAGFRDPRRRRRRRVRRAPHLVSRRLGRGGPGHADSVRKDPVRSLDGAGSRWRGRKGRVALKAQADVRPPCGGVLPGRTVPTGKAFPDGCRCAAAVSGGPVFNSHGKAARTRRCDFDHEGKPFSGDQIHGVGQFNRPKSHLRDRSVLGRSQSSGLRSPCGHPRIDAEFIGGIGNDGIEPHGRERFIGDRRKNVGCPDIIITTRPYTCHPTQRVVLIDARIVVGGLGIPVHIAVVGDDADLVVIGNVEISGISPRRAPTVLCNESPVPGRRKWRKPVAIEIVVPPHQDDVVVSAIIGIRKVVGVVRAVEKIIVVEIPRAHGPMVLDGRLDAVVVQCACSRRDDQQVLEVFSHRQIGRTAPRIRVGIVGLAHGPAPARQIRADHQGIPAVLPPPVETREIDEVVLGKIPCLARPQAGFDRGHPGVRPARPVRALVLHRSDAPRST